MNLDHVGHFVPDIDEAGRALENLGFTLTPFSLHLHRSQPDGEPTTGSGNRCAMFRRGYLEFLTPIGDSIIAGEIRHAIERYTGAHLIAFGTANPQQDHGRLVRIGLDPLDPIALQREISTPAGNATARFTVVRVPSGSMPEGRIQYCQHHTPELVWQTRWLAHANRAASLQGVILCVANPRETAERYAHFTGSDPEINGMFFADPASFERRLTKKPPSVPWIAGCILESDDIADTADYFRNSRVDVRSIGSGRLLVELPNSVGGMLIFEPKNASPLAL
jgi:catechol 2,3-dioxygenase-like lactoylglutathione lyase family enzyme